MVVRACTCPLSETDDTTVPVVAFSTTYFVTVAVVCADEYQYHPPKTRMITTMPRRFYALRQNAALSRLSTTAWNQEPTQWS